MNEKQKKRIRSSAAQNRNIQGKLSDKTKQRAERSELKAQREATPARDELLSVLRRLEGIKNAEVILNDGILVAVHLVSEPGLGKRHYKHVVRIAFSASLKYELPGSIKFHVAEI